MTHSLQNECKCQNRSQECMKYLGTEMCVQLHQGPSHNPIGLPHTIYNNYTSKMHTFFPRDYSFSESLTTMKGEGTLIHRNLRSYVPIERVPHLTRVPSAAPLHEARNTHRHSNFTAKGHCVHHAHTLFHIS